ncbi:MAG: hypothetical protein EWV75_08915 [Microcystis wesenbergii Mw_QC_S_20081001_S30D]|uniref:Uncharacterized protein n=1 Tax=Microcystis wesenbergii Mw_QC_S_20081001_S30D TaxID=2486245 RepID=A0A552JP29_9CHRO|nr:MAG: hypothetical protein EWV73_20470 [Microcystis wesenbergii Mw_QC_B_20070930_S4D]TRU97533.1 MAG: hypothetical protein EWV75_08915 [Microcystis wesenbergii Mw_QC_S_20081001_S30D]TRV00204.1 MAG: hypothetical protein EWV74_12860 [Microcystis wesenbergii Mw_QC_S_20081001_S30]TRV15029.1 MAG: hypothetical protein EWV89_08350 [Microcystis wesenbergii Mw_QC_B_20070930_S4]
MGNHKSTKNNHRQPREERTEQLMNACFPNLSGAINWEFLTDRTWIVHVQFAKASKGLQGIGGVFLASSPD